MNQRHLEILQHALGLDKYGQGSFYRNRFVTGPGTKDWEDCNSLVDDGMMTVGDIEIVGPGERVFSVTQLGKEYIAKHSPKPPKLTASQRRYRRYLAYDSSMSFREFLKMDSK